MRCTLRSSSINSMKFKILLSYVSFQRLNFIFANELRFFQKPNENFFLSKIIKIHMKCESQEEARLKPIPFEFFRWRLWYIAHIHRYVYANPWGSYHLQHWQRWRRWGWKFHSSQLMSIDSHLIVIQRQKRPQNNLLIIFNHLTISHANGVWIIGLIGIYRNFPSNFMLFCTSK